MSKGKENKDDFIGFRINGNKKAEFEEACNYNNLSMARELERHVDEVIKEKRLRIESIQNPNIEDGLSIEDRRVLWDISRENGETMSETVKRLIHDERNRR